ncbi:MAG: fatty acyl-AMP ligase [Candidatus Sericytochromatia bacterium]
MVSTLQTADWASLLSDRAQSLNNRLAYRFLLTGEPPARELNYAGLLEQAGSLARQLRLRFAPGSHLLLLFEPGLDFCLAFWACLLAGMVAVPAYPPADPRMRERFMAMSRDAGASGVLTTAAIRRLITLARWFMPSLRRLDWVALDELPALAGELPTPAAPDALALLQYTSGSTGTPRGVMLSHANLWHNMLCLEGARQSAPVRAAVDSLVSWLPLYHDMGLMTGVIFPIFVGTGSTLFSPLHFLQKPVRWLKALSDSRATISAAPNFAYEFCLRRIRDEQLTGIDLSHWEASLNGAEAIRPSTLRDFYTRFAPYGLRPDVLYPCYGLAESTVFVTGSRRATEPLIKSFSESALKAHRVASPADASDARELVSVGTPYGDTRLAIVDPETSQRCAPDAIGEIWIQGGSVGQGYWQQPEATAELFQAELDGERWLRSGDLGFIDQGQLFMTGRIKDLIILQGQNHAPQSFELIAEAAHPAVRAGCVAAFGAGEPEGLVILAEIKPTAKDAPDEIAQAIRQAISEQAGVPIQDLKLVPKATLPKTSSGKLRRRASRDMYLTGKLKPWKK